MPIKPVDYQVMVPRTNDAARVQIDARNRNYALNQQQAADISQKAEESTRQVHSNNKAYETAIRERQEKGRQNSDSNEKRQKKRNKYESSSKTEDEMKSTTIDIRL